MYKYIKWFASLLLAAAMVFPITGMASAETAEPLQPPEQSAIEGEATDPAHDSAPPSDLAADEVAKTDSDTDVPAEAVDGTVAETPAVPTYLEAYNAMISLKTAYPEGMTWTNFTPYGRDGTESTYWFKGGKVQGASGGVGCAAFVFLLSDAAFGDLPARTLTSGGFTFYDVKVGDILRVDNNSHFVIVLQKSASGVIIAEANYNKSVHWGRAMSEAEVMRANFLVTRYPVGYLDPSEGDVDEVDQSGTESGLAWELTRGGMLTITGTGAIPDYDTDSRPQWEEYSDRISAVTIGDGITGIGNYAFYQSGTLSVYIPDTVTGIGSCAFYESGLVAVTIPGSVKTIGDSAFYHCQNLKSASISEGVQIIGTKAFSTCALEYMDFPSTITQIGSGSFMNCQSLYRVRFAPGNTKVTMESSLFSGCWYLADVTLPLYADCISGGMFASCLTLSELYIPAGIESIDGVGSPDGVPFTNCRALVDIYFGGSSAEWTQKSGPSALNYSGLASQTTVHFDAEFNNPFAADPDDTGDLVGGPDSTPENPGDPEHQHIWSSGDDWETNETHHWRTCSAANCPVTDDSQKAGYGAHSYGSWVTDTAATALQSGSRHRDCTLCGYCQTGSIPATGSSSGDSDSSSNDSDNSSGSSGGNSSAQKPGSSDTTTVTDTKTGTKTETTKKPDGSMIEVVTQKDGIVTTIVTDASGKAEIEIQLSKQAVQSARQGGQPVPLPVSALQAVRDIAEVQAVTICTGTREPVLVSVPVDFPTMGTVAVVVNADGSTSLLKTSVPADNSVVAALANDATVKIIDNSKRFSDVPAGSWMEDAIAFVSARELFAGTAETTFAPESPMTRAMLMTVLARFDGADTTGGDIWYAKGVEWAVARGISDGSNPNDSVTREQLVTMLWRYLGSPAAGEPLLGYTDADQISNYAQEAMRWAVENGLVQGFDDGRLSPQEPANRAQVAEILKNLIINITLDCI